jgi:hypothetical protein
MPNRPVADGHNIVAPCHARHGRALLSVDAERRAVQRVDADIVGGREHDDVRVA